jgi:hypothetical protein
MNYWQFKFNINGWYDWEEKSIGDIEEWRSPKNRGGKPNDIMIGDIVFLYRTDKKIDRGIHFISKVIKVDFTNTHPIQLEIIKDLKENIFKPENYGFQKVIQKINDLDQRSTSYYKFENNDHPERIYQLILNEENLIDDLKDILPTQDSNINTEIKIELLARLGQGKFRQKLINNWNGCSITGCKIIDILVASHIKPWKISNDKERLDVYNGLLLLPNLDKLFDRGYISFQNNGQILISDMIENCEELGINQEMKIKLEKNHKPYLQYHRENIFIK